MVLKPPDRQLAEPVVIASRTANPSGAADSKHVLPALRQGPEQFLKVLETQSLLKLHPILGHVPSVMEAIIDPI